MSKPNPAGQTDILLGSATRPVYPFFLVKFEQAEEKDEDYLVNIKVGPEIYNYIKTGYGGEEVPFYFDVINGKIEAWTPQMIASFQFAHRLGKMNSLRIWIQNARPYLAKLCGSLGFDNESA